MAEARLGVRPMAGLQRSGFEVDTNVKVFQANVSKSGLVVYIPHPKFLFRSVRRTLFKAINKMRVAFMPVPLWAVFATVGAFAVQVERSSSASWLRSGSIADVLWNIDSHSPIARRLPTWVRVGYLAGWASFGVVYLLSATQRFALRRLLSYHDWLVRAHQKTLKTRVWGLIMKHVFLRRISHHLNAYQWCLPRLPLPAAKDTIARYLETVKPLLSQEEYDEHAKEAAEFLRTEAFSIQWRLWLKQKWDRNYISQWWLDLVYLRSRDSLPINSNWYGMSFAEFKPTTKQTVRAAVATYHLVRIKIALEQERLEPQILAGVAPLCMAQYDNAFSCTRIPGAEQDRLERYDKYESRHVVVMHKGRIFKLPVYSPNSMNQLSPLQLLRAFEGIVNDNRPPENGEELLPALTTLNRSEWHQIRNEYFVEDEYNRSRLEAIESSLFVVVLSEAEPADGDWTAEGRAYMCGSCHELWCDKSFNLVITKNAKAGVHAEHSWGDAPALAHITEMMMLCEKVREFYTPEGEVKTLPIDESKIAAGKFAVYRAERVDFQVRAPLRELAQDATNKFLAAAADFDLSVGCFTKFGKTHIGKKLQVSPDAFIQMSLQLAYFRDQDHFDLTYESATTRLFRDGRTETIRSLSQESVAFVKTFLAYEKGNASKADALKALRAACERHQAYTINAMRGHGVDRHLFAMFVVSYGIQKPSPFLKKAISRAWRLSTSQVPPNQCGDAAHAAVGGEMYCPNGGFGPVADDGYGVCYNVWPNRLYFNVSAKNKAPNTSAKRFLDRVLTALVDVGSLGNE